MTMDIYQRTIRADTCASLAVVDASFHDGGACATAAAPAALAKKCQKTVKRSFDVAFLMAPDDLSKRRRDQLTAVVHGGCDAEHTLRCSPPVALRPQVFERGPMATGAAAFADPPRAPFQLNPLSLTVHTHSRPDADRIRRCSRSPVDADVVVRSAFTKVANHTSCVPPSPDAVPPTLLIPVSPSSASSTTSNRSGLSPDLIAYQDSLSPQPALPARSPVHLLGAKHHTHHPHAYQPPSHPALQLQLPPSTHTATFVKKETERCSPHPPHQASGVHLQYLISNSLAKEGGKHAEDRTVIFDADPARKSSGGGGGGGVGHYALSKHNGPYGGGAAAENVAAMSPYSGYGVAGFPFAATLAPAAVAAAAAAANLGAALLPSSLAALTLPAQNVCAKCNMHFRMTSDLVYHMRSHHKNENVAVDPYKRRRDQDKLRCPVCQESFRERHHLTRHMTAHQDKAEDGDGPAGQASGDAGPRRQPPPVTGSAAK